MSFRTACQTISDATYSVFELRHCLADSRPQASCDDVLGGMKQGAEAPSSRAVPDTPPPETAFDLD
eukprot:5731372-Karenia_brevis.AAC.1